MKKLILLALTIICASSIYGQTEYNKYRAVTLSFGPRTASTDPGTLVTTFTDNSPAPDNLMSTTQVEDSYSGLGIAFGYKWGKFDGLAQEIDVDITTGSVFKGGIVQYGIGWNFATKIGDRDFMIRPSGHIGFGNFGFEIDELPNNTGFIQIGESIYSESALDAELKSQVFIYGGSLDLVYKALKNMDVFVSTHYDLSGDNARGEIVFTSQADGARSSTLELNGENPKLTYNGEETTSLPYTIGGLRLQVGVSYIWNRD